MHRSDCRCIEYEGKCACDGAMSRLKTQINSIVGKTFGPGTHALVRHLAEWFACSLISAKRLVGQSNAWKHLYVAYVPPVLAAGSDAMLLVFGVLRAFRRPGASLLAEKWVARWTYGTLGAALRVVMR